MNTRKNVKLNLVLVLFIKSKASIFFFFLIHFAPTAESSPVITKL